MRGILYPRVLEAIVLLLLQRLNSVALEAGNNPEAGQALLLQAPYPIKKWLEHLKLIAR
jgi:hypothetical protein